MKELKYEEALGQLEKLVAEIENPDRSFETVSKDVEKAVKLIQYCRKKLRDNETEMNKIITFEK